MVTRGGTWGVPGVELARTRGEPLNASLGKKVVVVPGDPPEFGELDFRYVKLALKARGGLIEEKSRVAVVGVCGVGVENVAKSRVGVG